jgi:hypothetical protein
VSATSCDDDTTERGRMSIRTRFLGRRLRTLTGRVAAAISSGGAAMGRRKELGARCREEVEAAEGRCCPDRTAIEITGAGWRGGQASGGSGQHRVACTGRWLTGESARSHSTPMNYSITFQTELI